MDGRIVRKRINAGVEFSGCFEGETLFYSRVEFGEELVNGRVGYLGNEAGEGEEVDGGLVEEVRNMSRVDIWDEASFVGKWQGVEVSIGKAMEGWMVDPCGRGGGNGMMEISMETWWWATGRLEGGIWCRGGPIVGEGKLSTKECVEGGGKARGGGDGRRGEYGFKKVKEGLDSGDSIGDVGVENVAMLTEVRVGADCMEMMQGAREGRDMSEGAKWTGGEGRRDIIGAVGAMGEKEVVVFFVVFGGNMEETSVTEGSKVVKELGTG